jgi:beta-glucosidase-like glycosyl hydrolase
MELGAIVKGYSIEEAATQAVLAGVDMVLIAHTMSRQTAVVNTLVQGVLTGRIPYRRVIDAASRISTLKQTYVRSPFKDVAEEKFWESEIQGIGCKEHHDVVANVIHQSAVVSGRGVVRERKFRLNLW